MRASICMAVLIIVSTSMFGQQHVVKRDYMWRSSGPWCPANEASGNPDSHCDVTVWSDKDTERLIAAAQQNTQQAAKANLDSVEQHLNDEINALQAKVRGLSDDRDALTKRLDDLEKQINKQGQTGAAKIAFRVPEHMRVALALGDSDGQESVVS